MENNLVRYCIYCGKFFTAPNADTWHCILCHYNGTYERMVNPPAPAFVPVPICSPTEIAIAEGVLDFFSEMFGEEKEEEKKEEEEKSGNGWVLPTAFHLLRLFF